MAGLAINLPSGELNLTAATKTMVQAKAPTHQRVKCSGMSVSFKGTAPNDAPLLVELLRQTDAGVGGISATLVKADGLGSETIQTTGLKGIWTTTEPTAGDILEQFEVHPQGGMYDKDWAFERPYWMPGGTRLAIRVTAGGAVVGVATLRLEE